MKNGKCYFLLAVVAVLLLVSTIGASIAAAQDGRGIKLTTTWPSITAKIGEKIELPMKLTNSGESGEYIDLEAISASEGWECWLERAYNKYGVRTAYVAPGETVDLYFKAEPPAEAEAGDYRFNLKAVTKDRAIESPLEITIALSGGVVVTGGVRITCSYPVLRGPCGTKFKFSSNINNGPGEDRVFNLSAIAPQGWEVSFQPMYKEEVISSISLKAADSSPVDIAVTPLPWEKPGEYTVTVEASSGTIKDSIDLKMVLTGSYKLDLRTEWGRLNANATAGEDSYLSIFTVNAGSADLHDITFSSTKPEGWVVTFSPDRIDSLPVGTMQEVVVAMKPASKAIVGDYYVTLGASAEQLQESMDIRVTVGAPTTWGWVGAGIIVVVIAGLAVLFMRLGRR
jgi:uncharacterized membrane protein